jgi:glycosyltransferase involved in cell wall biosynthesis
MKVLYITNALTHYYNLVLSKLNSEDNIELVCVAPKGNNSYQVGAGVKLTNEGINFKVIELEERRRFYLYATFKGLAKAIANEKPDIIIVIRSYLPAFLFDIYLRYIISKYQIGILLRDHPFRVLNYQDSKNIIKSTTKEFDSIPLPLNNIIITLRLDIILRRIQLEVKKRSYNIPDAHAIYIDAISILSSYGVDRKKIFITRNSPDTDRLFETKKKIDKLSNILPNNPYRIIHVGRLVAWKRVDMLIRAFATVKQKYPAAELLIIGTGPEETRLKQMSRVLNLDETVQFLGGIYEPTELGQYLTESSLYVLAGMGGLSINDAMSFGLPILCSVCDGTETFLVREGENGRYFKDGNENDLTDKILWFFENLDKLNEMGSRSEEIIRKEVNVNTVIQKHLQALSYIKGNIDARNQ